MYPELFHIGHLTIYSYGFFIVLGLAIAYFFLKWEWKRNDLGTELVNEVFLWSIFGVVLGGKIFFFFERPGYYANHMREFFGSFGSGFVFYGSFLVTIIILLWFFRRKKLNFLEQLDFISVGGAIVHAFGKIGCFMAGCCYGKTCEPAWYSVKFADPKSAAQPLNHYLYATQIWDSLIVFITLSVMLYVKPRKQFHGQLLLVYAIIYGVGRFFTENYRGDEVRGFLFDGLFSHSQFIAITIVIFSLSFYIYKIRLFKMKKNPAIWRG